VEAWDGSGVWKWCAWIKLEDSRASSGKWSVDWDIHSFTSACCFCSSWDGPSPQSPPPQSPPPSCAMYGRPKHTCFACGVSYERTAESGGYRTCVNEARSVQFWGSEEPREKEEGGMGRGRGNVDHHQRFRRHVGTIFLIARPDAKADRCLKLLQFDHERLIVVRG